MSPTFLTLAEVLEIHRDQIGRYGGRPGIRDVGLLRSAISMPAAGSGEQRFHQDLFEMAAAYLFHIVLDHPFVDGNKRAGAVAALVFLSMNDVELDVDEDSFEEAILRVARGEWDKRCIAGFLRDHSHPSPPLVDL